MLCLHYTGWLLRRLENHTEQGFCSLIITVIQARFSFKGRIIIFLRWRLENFHMQTFFYKRLLLGRRRHKINCLCKHFVHYFHTMYFCVYTLCEQFIAKFPRRVTYPESHIGYQVFSRSYSWFRHQKPSGMVCIILGDPGAVSRVDKKFVMKVYCTIETSPWALRPSSYVVLLPCRT